MWTRTCVDSEFFDWYFRPQTSQENFSFTMWVDWWSSRASWSATGTPQIKQIKLSGWESMCSLKSSYNWNSKLHSWHCRIGLAPSSWTRLKCLLNWKEFAMVSRQSWQRLARGLVLILWWKVWMCFLIPQTSMNILSHNVPKRRKYYLTDRVLRDFRAYIYASSLRQVQSCDDTRHDVSIPFSMWTFSCSSCTRKVWKISKFQNVASNSWFMNSQTFHWDARDWRVSASAHHTRTSCRNVRTQPSSQCVLIECATEAAASYERFFRRTRRPIPEKGAHYYPN